MSDDSRTPFTKNIQRPTEFEVMSRFFHRVYLISPQTLANSNKKQLVSNKKLKVTS